MSDTTKQKALVKLAAIKKKVGYPDKWKDYSKLQIGTESYVQNMINGNLWHMQYQLNKLYKPVDRKIYFNKVNFAVQNSDVIIAISKQTKNDIIHFLKVDENKVKVHYQGCHPAFKKGIFFSRKKYVTGKT